MRRAYRNIGALLKNKKQKQSDKHGKRRKQHAFVPQIQAIATWSSSPARCDLQRSGGFALRMVTLGVISVGKPGLTDYHQEVAPRNLQSSQPFNHVLTGIGHPGTTSTKAMHFLQLCCLSQCSMHDVSEAACGRPSALLSRPLENLHAMTHGSDLGGQLITAHSVSWHSWHNDGKPELSGRSTKNWEYTNSCLHFPQVVFFSESRDFFMQASHIASWPSLMYSWWSFCTQVPQIPLHRKELFLRAMRVPWDLKRSKASCPSTCRSSLKEGLGTMRGGSMGFKEAGTFGSSLGSAGGRGNSQAAALARRSWSGRKKRCLASRFTASQLPSISTDQSGRAPEEVEVKAVTKPSCPSNCFLPVPMTTTVEPSLILGATGASLGVVPGKSWTVNLCAGEWAWARPLKQALQ